MLKRVEAARDDYERPSLSMAESVLGDVEKEWPDFPEMENLKRKCAEARKKYGAGLQKIDCLLQERRYSVVPAFDMISIQGYKVRKNAYARFFTDDASFPFLPRNAKPSAAKSEGASAPMPESVPERPTAEGDAEPSA